MTAARRQHACDLAADQDARRVPWGNVEWDAHNRRLDEGFAAMRRSFAELDRIDAEYIAATRDMLADVAGMLSPPARAEQGDL